MEYLFSYGTLQQEGVQRANFGRILEGVKDRLPQYRIGMLRISDPRVIKESGKKEHPILEYTGNAEDFVEGTVFVLSKEELIMADDYEVDDYIRVEAQLESGSSCWIYAARRENI